METEKIVMTKKAHLSNRTGSFRAALGAIALLFAVIAPFGSSDASAKQRVFLTEAWVQVSPIPGRPAAVYLVIENRHNRTDRLLAVESPAAASISIHRTRSTNGISSMEKIDHLEIPAGSTTILAPGKLHFMLVKTSHDMASRKSIRIRLHFEKAGWIEIEAQVQSFGRRNGLKD